MKDKTSQLYLTGVGFDSDEDDPLVAGLLGDTRELWVVRDPLQVPLINRIL